MTGDLLSYTGGWLDRASARRTDSGWLNGLLAAGDARVIPLWRDQCLVGGDPPVPVEPRGEALAAIRLAAPVELVFLGLDDDERGVFAADLSGLAEPEAIALAGADRVQDVRAIVAGLSPAAASHIAYARGLLYWHRNQRFCGACGTSTAVSHGGHQRRCENADCGRLLFPKIEPAVIMVVESGERILLARHNGADPDGYSTLAGFVEIGESLEDAVRREVAEEAGLAVGDVRYAGSQAWPFPAGVMIGFRASALTETVTVDGEELIEARWFTRDELTELAARRGRLGRIDSIGNQLLRDWLRTPASSPA